MASVTGIEACPSARGLWGQEPGALGPKKGCKEGEPNLITFRGGLNLALVMSDIN
jgi:hypothetical protein